MCRYDALLAAGNSWEELCMRGVLHGGDNDSTGAIACAWFGALYGFTDVPQCNYQVSICDSMFINNNSLTITTSTILRPLGFVGDFPGESSTRKLKPIWIYWSKR